ncbi:hypothetical protein XAP6164_1800002 [Xanthomonas phaseoli pv. phaseoli]|nr:hypothetical protein XAP6164_1800002 [Xanthomonas phaseoli pv. phaseoli]
MHIGPNLQARPTEGSAGFSPIGEGGSEGKAPGRAVVPTTRGLASGAPFLQEAMSCSEKESQTQR